MDIRRLALFGALGTTACTVGPDSQRPSVFSPASWFTARTPTAQSIEASMPIAEPVDPEWWRSFNDPVLTGPVWCLPQPGVHVAPSGP